MCPWSNEVNCVMNICVYITIYYYIYYYYLTDMKMDKELLFTNNFFFSFYTFCSEDISLELKLFKVVSCLDGWLAHTSII